MKIAGLLLLAALASDAAGAPPVTRGDLKISVALPPGQSAPRELAVRVRPSRVLRGQENHPWEIALSSPLRNGEIACEVPAGRVDLRLQGTAMMPVYRWSVEVKPGETRLLDVKLERGAAISGWVRTLQEEIPTHSVLVSLAPESVGSFGRSSRPLRTISLESTSRPWGFFRFAGVKPGRYVVRASDPGLPPVHSDPIVIEGDRSFEMPDPLWVTPPVGLEITVHPPAAPDGRPWNFLLQPDRRLDEGETWRPWIGTSSKLGRWQVQGLPPGDYWLAAGLAEDNVWQKQKIHLGIGSRSIDVSLPLVPVRGRLTWRGNPMTASLDFNDESGSAVLQADAQGRFQGYLPNMGPWEVGVASRELRFHLNLEDLVRPAKGASFAWLEIRIPDTALPLEVVDSRGRSLSRATVDVLGKVRNQMTTDELGRFALVGLKPGPQCLRASSDSGWSEETSIALRGGDETPPLRLIIPDSLEISGRVLPRLGFAPGTQVVAWPAGSAPSVRGAFELTDEDGRLGLAFPPGTRKVSLVVLPPGSALRILEADVARERLLEIHVDTAGGTLVLGLPEQDLRSAATWSSASRTPRDPCSTRADERDVVTMPRLLRRWADLQGTPQTPGQLVVPNVEPGAYTLCATDKSPVLRRGAPPPGDSRCVGGVLEAAGELALKLPVVQPAQLRESN